MIKSVMKFDENPSKDFPKLMSAKASGIVYLMLNAENGIRVSGKEVGRSCILLFAELQDFDGTITLSNE